MNWHTALAEQLERSDELVVVTIVATRGSTPRETGATMLVTANETIGTIGGGVLEFAAVQRAVQHLSKDGRHIEKQVLGPDCGQCCGGVVELLFDRWDRRDLAFAERIAEAREGIWWRGIETPIDALVMGEQSEFRPGSTAVQAPELVTQVRRDWLQTTAGNRAEALATPLAAARATVTLFGGGHVGSACIEALSRLAVPIRLVESRSEMLRECYPAGVEVLDGRDWQAAVAAAPAGSDVLIMTHDHALDLAICGAALRRSSLRYCGLIGSRSKRLRFEKRLRSAGLRQSELARLSCPIGLTEISDKSPAGIAAGVAADYLIRGQASAAVPMQLVGLKT